MNAELWNKTIASLPAAHILQTWEWGQFKARYGWKSIPILWVRGKDGLRSFTGQEELSSGLREQGIAGKVAAAALTLSRDIPLRGLASALRVMYVPKGPLLEDWGDAALRSRVLGDLRLTARRHGAIFVKIDPDVAVGAGIPGVPGAGDNPAGLDVLDSLGALGWQFSAEQVQFRNTVTLDLQQSEEQLLAGMKQKARYNLRLAQRRGVAVRAGGQEDLRLLYRMYAETSVRDGFVIRDEPYYMGLWQTFLKGDPSSGDTAGCPDRPAAEPLIAEVEGEPIAAIIVFRFARGGWYLYGMSLDVHRERMPNYLLQWEAICRLKAAGCMTYDLWGAPDRFDEGDPMWGVFRFKEGLGGRVVRTVGAWDLPVRPLFYRLYTQTLPRLLELMRRRGKARTRQELSM
jgi:lipid II:glycine glycyltransferase (peptidoglycan interpeptide bridge formation enzyme)